MQFTRYIGIDYSGAKAPVSRLRELQVFVADETGVVSPVAPYDTAARNWCRKEVARFVREALQDPAPCIIGIDHGFSFPGGFFERENIVTWDGLLNEVHKRWPTDRDHMYVDFARTESPVNEPANEYRLCERWSSSAKSVFQFDVQGSVAKSTFAGLPWIRAWRADPKLRYRTHFWPFDGFDVPDGKHVVAECYPSLFRRRYPNHGRTSDQQDAFAIASWLSDMDRRGALADYFNPPLTLPERRLVRLEGWILGVR